MQKENQIESKIRILLMVTGILLIGLAYLSFELQALVSIHLAE